MPDDTYTHGHQPSVLRSHTWRTIENSAAYLSPRLEAGLDVLDVGCGPGTITAEIAARVTPGRVVGLDRSEEVIGTAAALDADNLSFRVGDVYALDFPDDSFDVVHAHQVVQHLSDPVAALREMRRVCRPDGMVAVRDADYSSFAWAPEDDRLRRWLDVYLAVARSNDAEPDAGRHLKGWALDAGFSSIESSASVWCFTDDDDRAWWGGLWADRVVDSDLAAQAVERGLSTDHELADMADAFRAWAERSDGWFAVLHGEVLARP
ncbi:methyltransferase domain-containing protein [Actinospongicola halichondriae]|uniref:methyltransferase domain-containing protein n=1 Tax=Actinospongicola halichondriae TaxID=3236844 RepID=UPI003D40ACFF